MCSTSVAVFLCLSQWTPLPSRVTFVNLDIRGLELRRMALNLFSLKDGLGKTTEKMGDNDEIQKKLKVVETQLMSIITSSESLIKKFNEIIKLSAKMDEHRKSMKSLQDDAKIEVSEESQGSNTKKEILLPISIIAACCDMSTIADK